MKIYLDEVLSYNGECYPHVMKEGLWWIKLSQLGWKSNYFSIANCISYWRLQSDSFPFIYFSSDSSFFPLSQTKTGWDRNSALMNHQAVINTPTRPGWMNQTSESLTSITVSRNSFSKSDNSEHEPFIIPLPFCYIDLLELTSRAILSTISPISFRKLTPGYPLLALGAYTVR